MKIVITKTTFFRLTLALFCVPRPQCLPLYTSIKLLEHSEEWQRGRMGVNGHDVDIRKSQAGLEALQAICFISLSKPGFGALKVVSHGLRKLT